MNVSRIYIYLTSDTIDHGVTVRDEKWCTPPYLNENLTCLFVNIHQYTSICIDGIYLVFFFAPYPFDALGGKGSQNLNVFVINIIGLIQKPSKAART